MSILKYVIPEPVEIIYLVKAVKIDEIFKKSFNLIPEKVKTWCTNKQLEHPADFATGKNTNFSNYI